MQILHLSIQANQLQGVDHCIFTFFFFFSDILNL